LKDLCLLSWDGLEKSLIYPEQQLTRNENLIIFLLIVISNLYAVVLKVEIQKKKIQCQFIIMPFKLLK